MVSSQLRPGLKALLDSDERFLNLDDPNTLTTETFQTPLSGST